MSSFRAYKDIFSLPNHQTVAPIPQRTAINMEREITNKEILINAFFIIVNLYMFLLFNNNLSFFDMQIKRYFLRLTSKTENIYRKTIKQVCFSIIMQEI
ncbi:hypothetical protein DWX27_17935 [Bacteroides intestinalis]|uniref:Uncharacterized protein n=1 Tax=Bacteroides intestinalis TaxID=329854 RepID=A0AAQ0RRD3_9BACE|nr:hypothetical protein DWX27_17935 [Bacteroides intestinalis]